MFIPLSKLLEFLVSPLRLSLVLWGVGILTYWQWPTCGLTCGTAGAVLLFLSSNPLIGAALLRPLENTYPSREPQTYPRGDAIVVLGGVGFDRLLYGIRLLRAGRAPLLVLSGGIVPSRIGTDMTEAARMRRLAIEFGVTPKMILVEERSRNTRENALFTRQLLEKRGKKILLVTSAGHMLRAAAVFRNQQLEVIPVPTDLRIIPKALTLLQFLPALSALEYSTTAVKEYTALLLYRLKGWIEKDTSCVE